MCGVLLKYTIIHNFKKWGKYNNKKGLQWHILCKMYFTKKKWREIGRLIWKQTHMAKSLQKRIKVVTIQIKLKSILPKT